MIFQAFQALAWAAVIVLAGYATVGHASPPSSAKAPAQHQAVSSPQPNPGASAEQNLLAGLAAVSSGDFAKAMTLLAPLAHRGNAEAQFYLGSMYYGSHGVPQDFEQAVAWYRKAAAQGNAYAQGSLGIMYELGVGEPKDLIMAYALYNSAATLDPSNKLTVKRRSELSSQLSPAALNKAQQLTHELLKPGNFAAAFDRRR